MDLELLFWVVFFVGGYGALLAYLLRIAMRGEGPPGEGGSGT